MLGFDFVANKRRHLYNIIYLYSYDHTGMSNSLWFRLTSECINLTFYALIMHYSLKNMLFKTKKYLSM